MITQAAFMGGSQELAPSVNFDLVPQAGRVIQVTPDTSGLEGRLVDARRFHQTGGPIAWVLNLGSDAFEVRDHSGSNLVATVEAGEVATILLVDNTTEDGEWAAFVRTILT